MVETVAVATPPIRLALMAATARIPVPRATAALAAQSAPVALAGPLAVLGPLAPQQHPVAMVVTAAQVQPVRWVRRKPFPERV